MMVMFVEDKIQGFGKLPLPGIHVRLVGSLFEMEVVDLGIYGNECKFI